MESNLVKVRKKIDGFLNSGNNLPKRWKWEVFDRTGLEIELDGSGLQLIAMWPKFRFFSDSWFILVGKNS
jgi:hypothetical protein